MVFSLDEVPYIGGAAHGALFVVRGDLTRLDADAYVVPSDSFGHIEPIWKRRVRVPRGGRLPERNQIELRESGATEVPRELIPVVDKHREPVFAVNVGGGQGVRHRIRTVEVGLGRGLQLLNAWSKGWRTHGTHRRVRPLVAMPLLGLGQAGLESRAGEVIARMLAVVDTHFREVAAAEGGIHEGFDLVLVCWSESDYAAVQHERAQRLSSLRVENPWLLELEESARNHELAVLFGAGASASLGLPTWADLLGRLTGRLEREGKVHRARLDSLAGLERLDPTDAATLLIETGGTDWFLANLKEIMSRRTYGLTHALMASLRPPIAITTNYDRGFEMACDAIAKGDRAGEAKLSPSQSEQERAAVAVLPWDRPEPGQQLLLKLHGDLEKGHLVLSRDHFVAMHAFRRPLAGLMQSRMFVGHLVTLGTSMSDATLVGAAEEFRALIQQSARSQTHHTDVTAGTVLLTSPDPARASLLERTFRVGQGATEGIELPWSDHVPTKEAARQIDLLLDWLGMHAADTLAFALDPRYAALLEPADREMAEELAGFADGWLRSKGRGGGDLVDKVAAFLTSLGYDPARESDRAWTYRRSTSELEPHERR